MQLQKIENKRQSLLDTHHVQHTNHDGQIGQLHTKKNGIILIFLLFKTFSNELNSPKKLIIEQS